MPTSRIAIVLGPLLAMTLACGVHDRSAQLESEHTEGDLTFAEERWLWADESEEEFKKYAADVTNTSSGAFLPVDHPMTLRLQWWVDRLDDALRAAHPTELGATPRPRILLLRTTSENAWVTALPVTWSVKARVVGPPAGSVGGPALFLDRTGSVHVGTGFERPFGVDDIGSFARHFSDGFSQCRIAQEGDAVVFAETCAPTSGLAVSEAGKLGYYATAKHLTFTTAFVARLLDEDRVVSTIAHELGHYYRSHSNMPTDALNYFYSLEEPSARKPPPDPRYLAQTTKAREKLRLFGIVDWSEENALMRDRRLGFYTTEQEADEIELELLAKVGIPPGVGIDKVLTLLKAAGERGGEVDPFAFRWAECSTLRDRGWKDADGREVSVPVGAPISAHHNMCFRAFNMTREIQAHHYAVAERPTPPGDPWSRLLARFEAERDTRAPSENR